MLAKDIMRRDVLTVGPETSLRDAARLFIEHGITGAPVVAEYGRLAGVLSQTDLVRHSGEVSSRARGVSRYYWDLGRETLRPDLAESAPAGAAVRDVMTPAVLSGEEDTPIRDLARLMLRRRIHRVIITREGKLAGIVTTTDLMRALLDLLEEYEPQEAAARG